MAIVGRRGHEPHVANITLVWSFSGVGVFMISEISQPCNSNPTIATLVLLSVTLHVGIVTIRIGQMFVALNAEELFLGFLASVLQRSVEILRYVRVQCREFFVVERGRAGMD